MEQNPSWKANQFAASQEIPPFLLQKSCRLLDRVAKYCGAGQATVII
jgi:hypothetical protein